MITKINEAKTLLNANSMVQHVIQIKNEIMKHANVSVKIFLCAKKIKVGNLGYVFMRMPSI